MNRTRRPARPRVLVLAIDGLDWSVMQSGVDAGQLPFVAQLLEAGSSARLAPSPGGHSCAWTSAATGVWPDRHGVCHDLSLRADGLSYAPASREAILSPALWQVMARAGRRAWTIGWPVTLPNLHSAMHPDMHPQADQRTKATAPERAVQGFERAPDDDSVHWPMSPAVYSPASLRETLHDSRIHPDDFVPDDLHCLLPEGAPPDALVQARRLIARWSSIQDLGLRWAEAPEWDLLALRLDGLPEWIQTLRAQAPQVRGEDALALWLPWLDLVLGRYMGLLGREVGLVLVSDRGLSLTPSPLTHLGPGARAGGLAMAGPGIAADALLADARLVDLAPTVLGRLGLEIPPDLDGRDLLAHSPRSVGPLRPLAWPRAPWPKTFAPQSQDQEALDWLARQGLEPLDMEPLREIAAQIEAESLVVWAQYRLQRGHAADAVAALEEALERLPQAPAPLRLLLGQNLLWAGRVDAARALLRATPDPLLPGCWPDLCEGLIAFADADWPQAARHFARIIDTRSDGVHEASAGHFNAAAWLGWCALEQQDLAAAADWFERAVGDGPLPSHHHEGRARALLALGRGGQAREAVEDALVERPHAASLHLLLAQARRAEGQWAEARKALWRAFQLDASLTTSQADLIEAFGLNRAPVEAGVGAGVGAGDPC